MNGSQNSDSPRPDSAENQKLLEWILKFQDGTLSSEETAALERQLLSDEEARQHFIEIQMQSFAINGIFRREAYEQNQSGVSFPGWSRRQNRWFVSGVLTAAVLSLCLAVIAWVRPLNRDGGPPALVANPDQENNGNSSVAVESSKPEINVRVVGLSRAQFFGEYNPPLHSLLNAKRDYILTEGLVELAFPTGASVIVEAPAVFRILDNECLTLDTGRCSVHAPEGAEGFRVETPTTQVVDRGTRFLVTATEGMETEVQVVEGAADVFWKSEGPHSPSGNEIAPSVAISETPSEVSPKDASVNSADVAPPAEQNSHQVRLEKTDAQRFSGTESVSMAPVRFTPQAYRASLPDRIMSYEATRDERGCAQDLVSVTVVRDGAARTYSAEKLILADLIWFKSYDAVNKSGHLSGEAHLPEIRGSWLSDLSLTSGVINPGGQKFPLNSDPVMNDVEDPLNPNTPGFAIRFREPVINGPGPDIVFFELQTLSNPPEGDPFHVSPVRFRPGLRSTTIQTYDLTLFSSETLPLSTFYLYQFDRPIQSLRDLEEMSCTRTHMRIGFRALAVGIDLSALGYAENEAVEELFFQDADDDPAGCIVDPVFIAGLPAERSEHDVDVLEHLRK